MNNARSVYKKRLVGISQQLRSISIVVIYSAIVLSLTLPQSLVAQVGDGTGGATPTPNPVNPNVGPDPGGPTATPRPVNPNIGPDPGGPIVTPQIGDDHGVDDPSSTSSATPSATPSGSGTSGNSSGPTEPPIELEVLDCPGVVREINAFKLPPSIYPKPNCGGGTPGGTTGPTGVCTTDPNVQAYGTSQEGPPEGAIFWTFIGATNGSIGQGFGPTDFGNTGYYDNYDYTLGLQGHPGVDVGAVSGTKLYTPVGGTVMIDGASGYFRHDPAGNAQYTGELLIELDNGDQLIIGHMSQIDVRKGDVLQPGQMVGLSGMANGADHLHLEYRKKLAHPQGEYTALDPRDVFGCVSTSTPAPTTQPGGGESNVQGVKTEAGKVLQAATVATNFSQFQEKYGFLDPSGPSGLDFEQYADNFAVERDLAVKYAPEFNLEPEMVVWWTWFETHEPFDSWHYQNCLNDTEYPIDQECGAIGSGDWQVGYGQQYSVGMGGGLKTAFEKTHGDPNNATLVQQVGQKVLTSSGLTYTMPAMTIDQLMASESSNRRWIFTLQRDQAISVYLLAQELRSDMDGRPSMKFAQVMEQWGGYYQSQETKQRYSNIMNDVLLNWGIVGSGTTDQVCKVGASTTNSNCSTMEDKLGGMSVEEFTTRINENMDAYKRIAECANVPWEMMAAIHLRETGLDANYNGPGSGGALGPWQIDPTGPLYGEIDPYNFEEAGCSVGKVELQGKAQSGPLGRPLSQNMDPTKKDDEYSIKDAFFAYNGRAGWEGNVEKGCTPALDGNPELNFDCSGYVMNNWDAKHTDMCIGTASGPFCDTNDGTWKTYYKLHFSTFDAQGKLLVYGGKCNLNSEVIDGYAAPTKPGLNINSQFFAPSHEGIDIANQAGDPIFALSDGEIIASGWVDMGGYYLILHIAARGSQPEMYVYYGHLEPGSYPEPGTTVTAGQQIGKTGELLVTPPGGGAKIPNGNTLGPHLHFDMRLTPGDPPREGHINPCTLDIMKNSYPTLAC